MATQNRRPLYAKIAIARKQLPHLDEDAYRELLKREFGKESSKELNWYQLERLIQLLAGLGAHFESGGSNRKVTAKARPDWISVPDDALHASLKRQILAIWKKLGYSMTSLETRVQRQFGTHTFAWVHDHEKLTALLTDLQKRERAFDKKCGATA